MSADERFVKLKQETWKRAFFCFATAYLFESRARRYKLSLNVLNFTGIGLPLLVGAMVMSFGEGAWLPYLAVTAGALSVVQLFVSGWSTVATWSGELAYAIESAAANHDLSRRYQDLLHRSADHAELERRLELIDIEQRLREQSDYQHAVTDGEKRMGHRAALRQFQKACDGCKIIPTSTAPSRCDICGNFRRFLP